MKKLFQILVGSTIILIIFISVSIMLDAYIDLKSTNYTVKISLSNLNDVLWEQDSLTIKTIEPLFDSNISRLESASNTLLQSNTVSFLFQILSFALISIGGYFLFYFQNKFKMIDKNSEDLLNIDKQVQENDRSMYVISNYIYSVVLLNRISNLNDPLFQDIIPKLRSYYIDLSVYLRKDNVFLNDSIILTCISIQSEINSSLKELNKDDNVKDLIKMNNDIKALFNSCRRKNS